LQKRQHMRAHRFIQCLANAVRPIQILTAARQIIIAQLLIILRDHILVDGGLAQVNAAQRVVEETGADVRIAGLAKRLEEVWVPGEEFPVILPRTSPALRLLQQLRDESHRFAIAFHRRKRSKAMTRSSLDAVAGLGPAKQKALLAAFGSVAKIKRATVEDLESVRGIGPSLARAIVEHFRSGASDPGARPVA